MEEPQELVPRSAQARNGQVQVGEAQELVPERSAQARNGRVQVREPRELAQERSTQVPTGSAQVEEPQAPARERSAQALMRLARVRVGPPVRSEVQPAAQVVRLPWAPPLGSAPSQASSRPAS